jgi:Protein of unknown function (DUF3106).
MMSLLWKFRTLVCVLCLSGLHAFAQTNNQSGSDVTRPGVPPEPAPAKSPVAVFRELLNMEPAERTKALADRPEETRRRILAKIREYQSLKPDERELRLKVTELGYYLRPLMRTPATNRAAQVAVIPVGYRELVQVRLVKWDKLTPAAQQKLLQNEVAIRALTEVTNGVSTNMTSIRSVPLQNTISNWNRLSVKEQKELSENYDYFFQLKPGERQKAVKILSKEEQAQITLTLRKYVNLSADQRAQCIQSFEKLAAMSPKERQQFFKNAERWEMMTPKERDDWRNLVETAPMLPPTTSMPPMPQSVSVPHNQPLATNGN